MGGIPRYIGDLPESLSPAMFVGTMLVGRLGISAPLLIARAVVTGGADRVHALLDGGEELGVPNPAQLYYSYTTVILQLYTVILQ